MDSPNWDKSFENLVLSYAAGLVENSLIAGQEGISEWTSKGGKSELSNERGFTTVIEFMWFLIAALCRDIYSLPRAQPEDRDAIQDNIVSAAINAMIERFFDNMSVEDRSKQASIWLAWYNRAEMDYGHVANIAPSRDNPSLDDNLSGKAATRIANEFGEQDNIALKINLSRLAMLAYTGQTKNQSAVPVPTMASDLLGALRRERNSA